MNQNIQIILKQAPKPQYPRDNSNVFEVKYTSKPSINDIPEGCVLVQNKFISIDASNRLWINGKRTYVRGVLPGQVMMGKAVGEVIASKGSIKVGTNVMGMLGWQKFTIMKQKQLQIISPDIKNPQLLLGALGISGLTAYVGLFSIGKIQKGQVVVVSAASGSVGEIAIQLAKKHGCIVCGIAGSDSKCQYVSSIGADFTINYKTKSVEQQLRKILPKGVDVYFDNVGGEILDAVLMNIKENSRIVLCGSISTYYGRGQPYKLKNYPRLIIKKCVMKGFIYFDHKEDLVQGTKHIQKLLQNSQLKVRYDWVNGVEQCPNALKKLLLGQNNGKVLVKVDGSNVYPKM